MDHDDLRTPGVIEAVERFDCFGSSCAVLVIGDGAEQAARLVRRRMLRWHERFSRFEPDSELSRLNDDPRGRLEVTSTMARLAEAAVWAAAETGGLVDSTLVAEIEQAGYVSDLGEALPASAAFANAPARRPASARAVEWWRELKVENGTLIRPPGLRLDSGGLGKGLFADLAAETLAGYRSFAVDCGGDLRLGGSGDLARRVDVASPFGGEIIHSFELTGGGVATSGIAKRSWLDASGSPAHHLLDPATGRPAFTGVAQATALAPTAVEAETLAKAAILSGAERAPSWLRHGGVLVLEDGSHQLVPTP
ncbi:MAG TPA: FAD:protein FMN transferase [Thermoleophilaceae bacterium]|nr:FAD:protein FMN transferase [Thermoleophilaceae bacterium]